jgi:uncharacterized delta-60 repeat protein
MMHFPAFRPKLKTFDARHKAWLFFVLGLLTFFRAQTATASPGQVDNGYDKALLNFNLVCTAVQMDGRVLAGGSPNGSQKWMARLNINGTEEQGFPQGVAGAVRCMAVQPDGKMLLGGNFSEGLVRLLPDGTVDAGFNVIKTGVNVTCITLLDDGRILIGGTMTVFSGLQNSGIFRRYMARLDPDGSLDTGFDAGQINSYWSHQDVTSIVVQPDGKILIAGNFDSVGGAPCGNVARLEADGARDLSFAANVPTGLVYYYYGLFLQRDGKILVCGEFREVGGLAQRGLVRLEANGAMDTTFRPQLAEGDAQSVVMQADGKILIGGDFTGVDGVTRNGLARLNSDGSLDTGFVPPTGNGSFGSLMMQGDGKLLAGGLYGLAGASPQNGVIRLLNDPAAGSLSVTAFNRVQWLRGGSSPEAARVTFDWSGDGGLTWRPHGAGRRIDGGWELAGPGLPASGLLRALARVPGGDHNGSSGLVRTIVPFNGLAAPEVVLSGNGVAIADGDNTPDAGDYSDFGGTEVRGGITVRTFTISNTGTAPLTFTASPVVRVEGTNAAEFTVTAPGVAVLAPGASTTFQASFDPPTLGVRRAVVRFFCDDADEADFEFAIQGTGAGLVPEIAVSGNDRDIAAGDILPAADDHTDFGRTQGAEGVLTRTFLITNHGTSALNLTGTPVVAVSGPQAADFIVTVPPPASIPAGTAVAFKVRFDPTAPGVRRATMTLANDDDDEAPFVFAVQGIGWSAGDLNPLLNPLLNGSVSVMAVQPDRKILLAGSFRTVNGVARNGMARVNPDGTLDADFGVTVLGRVECMAVGRDGLILVGGSFATVNGFFHSALAWVFPDGGVGGFHPISSGIVNAVALQADGKILVGGNFTQNGSNRCLSRLDAAGGPDPTFDSSTMNGTVYALGVQPDGKILVGSVSQTIGGVARRGLVRLAADGTLDTGFNPLFSSAINCLAVQADGAILVGGAESYRINGVLRTGLARLFPDGTLDTGFNPSMNGWVNSIICQTDGKIVVTETVSVAGVDTSRLARFLANGTRDASFAAGTNGYVGSVVMEQDGSLLIGGSFTTVGGASRFAMARLENDPAMEALRASAFDRMTWQREGSGPEAEAVIFDSSTDGGLTWAALGAGSRVAGGWELNGPGLPSSGLLRATAAIGGGQLRSSRSLVESVTAFSGFEIPELTLKGNGVEIADGDTTPGLGDHSDFGEAAVGGVAAVRTFTMSNTGLVPLRLFGDPVVRVTGAVAGEFVVTGQPAATVPVGGSTTFEVRFLPQALGVRTAVIRFASNDYDEAGFEFTLQGIGVGLAPEIAVRGNGRNITNGDTTPSSLDFTSFGRTQGVDGRLTKSFTIANTGTSALLLTGTPRVSVGGLHAADFSVTLPPAEIVAAGGDTVFVITFDPSSPGLRTAAVSLESDDRDEPLFVFSIQGVGWVAGNVDPGFTITTPGVVWSLAQQPDGGLLMGGVFSALGRLDTSVQVNRGGIALLRPDGAVDARVTRSFTSNGGQVYCTASRPDGRHLVGGSYSSVSGTVRNGLARLNADYTLDTTFNPNMTGNARGLLVLSDGRIMVGGEFTAVGGVARNGLARLDSNGGLDIAYDAKLNGATRCLIQQPDGKLVTGGVFTTVNGVMRNRIARLNPDGTLDAAFNPNSGSTPRCLALLQDGKILVGGSFSTMGGLARSYLVRLNPDGTVDTAFDPKVNGFVNSMAVQADGKIVIGGSFTGVGTLAARSIARLHSNGIPDSSFTVAADGAVNAVLLGADGKIITAGEFFTTPGYGIARLENDPAQQSLTVVGGARIQWLRGGTSPEVAAAVFELSTDGGINWNLIGAGTRIAGGWELNGLSLPASGKVRARAVVFGGFYNGSSSLLETVADFPVPEPGLEVQSSSGNILVSGVALVDFGTAQAGGPAQVRTFTLSNSGAAPLAVGAVTIDGANAGDFGIAPASSPIVPPGGSTAITVLFSYQASGARTAVLKIPTNITSPNPFSVNLAGNGSVLPAALAGVVRGEDGRVSLSFEGKQGQTYYIQRSSALHSWTTIHTVITGSEGLIQYVDEAAPAGAAFYRIMIP